MVNKSSETPEIPTEEGFKFKSHNKSDALITAIVLSPAEADEATEKYGGKKSTIHSCNA